MRLRQTGPADPSCIRTHMHTHTYAHTYPHTYTPKHTHTQIHDCSLLRGHSVFMNICTRVGMCTYIRMYVHEYSCLYNVCVFTWSCIYLSTFLCVFLVLYGRMCVRTPVHVSVCMCVCVRGCTRTCVSVCACMGASLPVRMCVCVTLQNTLHTYSFTHTRTHTQQYNLGVDVCSAFLAFAMRSPNSSTRPAKQVARNSLSSCLTLAARRGAKHCVQMLRANRPATPRERTHT